MLKVTQTLFNLFFHNRSTTKFFVGVILGFAFSIAVILATIGIMDGYQYSLMGQLKKSVGDIYFYSRAGLFEFDDEIKDVLNQNKIIQKSAFIQTEGFAIGNETSKGVKVLGVDKKSFTNVIKNKFLFKKGEIGIGSEIAKQFGKKVGDEIVIAFAKGNRELGSLPSLKKLKIGQIIHHGVYLKDSRIVYIDRSQLQDFLNLGSKINVITFNVPNLIFQKGLNLNDFSNKIKVFMYDIRDQMGAQYIVRTFWYEFSGILEAAKIEKLMITIILQLVVIISIFNVVAFIVFLNVRFSKEIFLYKALGLSNNQLNSSWVFLTFLVLIFSCGLSYILVKFFGWMLANFLIFSLPSDIYNLGRLELIISASSYIITFALSFIWIFILVGITLRSYKKKSVLYGVREVYN